MAAGGSLENITEIRAHEGRGGGVHIEVDFSPCHDDQRPDLVNSMNMVGVRMGQQDGIEPGNGEPEQLFAKIGRHVDEDLGRGAVFPGPFDQHRAAPAAVFWIVGIAGAPGLADARNPAGGSAAEDGEGQAHAASAPITGAGILENRRSALALVSTAIACGETPFTSANTWAVAATNAGSLRLPRYGTGAR